MLGHSYPHVPTELERLNSRQTILLNPIRCYSIRLGCLYCASTKPGLPLLDHYWRQVSKSLSIVTLFPLLQKLINWRLENCSEQGDKGTDCKSERLRELLNYYFRKHNTESGKELPNAAYSNLEHDLIWLANKNTNASTEIDIYLFLS